MIETRLFSQDPILGQTKWWHYDRDTDEMWIETVWDGEAIARSSYESRKEDTGRFNDGAHKIAQIPVALYWKLKKQHVFDDQKSFRRWFQSDEALPFKTKSCWL